MAVHDVVKALILCCKAGRKFWLATRAAWQLASMAGSTVHLQRWAAPLVPSTLCHHRVGMYSATSHASAPISHKQRRQHACSSTASSSSGQAQQLSPLDPDDPVLSYYAEFANVLPEDFKPPPTIIELARDAALEREDVSELLQDGLYQARIGTAAVIQDVFKRTRARDVRLKICTTLVGEVMQEIKESSDWKELQAVMQRLQAEAGPEWSWSQFERMQVYCLGSIEATGEYREMFPRPPPFGRHDIYRGWVASRALWQLAFALCLPSLLPGVQEPVSFRDPAFTVFDRRLISAMGGQVQTGNDGGWSPVEQPTFFYAPFCPHSVNERLFESNYSAKQLSGLAYLGTCTTFYSELKDLWLARIQKQQEREQLRKPGHGTGSQVAAAGACCQATSSPMPGQQQTASEGTSASSNSFGGNQEEHAALGEGEDDDDEDDLPDGTVHAASLAAAGVSLEASVPSIARVHTPAVRLHVFHQLEKLEQPPRSHLVLSTAR